MTCLGVCFSEAEGPTVHRSSLCRTGVGRLLRAGNRSPRRRLGRRPSIHEGLCGTRSLWILGGTRLDSRRRSRTLWADGAAGQERRRLADTGACPHAVLWGNPRRSGMLGRIPSLRLGPREDRRTLRTRTDTLGCSPRRNRNAEAVAVGSGARLRIPGRLLPGSGLPPIRVDHSRRHWPPTGQLPRKE